MSRYYVIAGLVCLILGLAGGCGGGKPEADSNSENEALPQPMYQPPPVKTMDTASLLRKLRSPSPTSRADAATALAEAAASDPSVIPGLLNALNDTGNRGPGSVFPNELNSTREAAVVALLKAGAAGETVLAEKGIQILITGLNDPDPAVREHTAVALGRAGDLARPATATLWKLAEDPSVSVRAAAYKTLLGLSPQDLQPLTALLLHPVADVRNHAAEMLSQFGNLTEECIPTLMQALKDEDSFIRNMSAQALLRFGSKAAPAISPLLEAMKKTQLSDLQKAEPLELAPIRALAAIGEPAVVPTMKLLSDPNPLIRYQAAYVLGEIGPDAKRSLPELEKLLRDPSGEVVLEAARAIAVISRDGSKTAALMKLALSHAEPNTRLYGLNTVLRMEEAGFELSPLVVPLLDDPSPEVRRLAIAYVSKLPLERAKASLPTLAERLSRERDETVRKQIAEMLEKLGSAAAPAAAALAKAATTDEAVPVREAALAALASIGPDGSAAIPELIRFLADTKASDDLRARTVTVLAIIAPSHPEVIATVLKETEESSPSIREAAANALSRLSPPTAAILNRLASMAKSDPSFPIRTAALRSLAKLGTAALAIRNEIEPIVKSGSPNQILWAKVVLARIDDNPEAAIPAVRAGLTAKNPGERQAAVEALPLLGRPSAADVTAVKALCRDRSPELRRTVAQTLGELGHDAKPAVSELVQLLKSDIDADVRRAAAIALGRIEDRSEVVLQALKSAEKSDPAVATAARSSRDHLESISK
jgi:HEAT repeat protein